MARQVGDRVQRRLMSGSTLRVKGVGTVIDLPAPREMEGPSATVKWDNGSTGTYYEGELLTEEVGTDVD